MNCELPDVQAGFRKGRGTRDQIVNIHWIIEKAREFQKNIHFCFIDYAKAFDCVDHNKLWKILKRWEYQTTFPASWEICMQVKKQQLEPNMEQWFQIGKGVHQSCVLSLCLFNLYAEYIMWNSRLSEAQAGIKIARRNINNLRHTDDTTLMAESEKELKSLLMKVKEESEKAGLKFYIQKTKSMASSLIYFPPWQIDGGTMEIVTDYFLGLQNHCGWWLQPWNSKTLLRRKPMTNLVQLSH